MDDLRGVNPLQHSPWIVPNVRKVNPPAQAPQWRMSQECAKQAHPHPRNPQEAEFTAAHSENRRWHRQRHGGVQECHPAGYQDHDDDGV